MQYLHFLEHSVWIYIQILFFFFIIIEFSIKPSSNLRQTPRDPDLGRDLRLGTTALNNSTYLRSATTGYFPTLS
jgi:hypothetical protein